MNRLELYHLHYQLTAEALKLMRVKNQDYGANDDPFRNFRRHGLLGMLVRLSDKLARLETFNDTGKLAVVNESVHDCVLDIINYAVLIEGWIIDDANRKGSTYGDAAGDGRPRSLSPEPGASFSHIDRGTGGSGQGHAGDDSIATAVANARAGQATVERRTGASSSSSKHVDNKSRLGGKGR